MGQAAQPIISINHGAHQQDRVRHLVRLSMITAVVMGALFCGVTELFPRAILRLFMDVTDSVLAIGPAILRTYAVAFLLMGVSIVAGYYFQSIMKNGQSLLISLLRGFFLSAALVFLLPAVFGFSAIWWAMPLTELITLVISVILVRKSLRNE